MGKMDVQLSIVCIEMEFNMRMKVDDWCNGVVQSENSSGPRTEPWITP